jgi:hypothetical protein
LAYFFSESSLFKRWENWQEVIIIASNRRRRKENLCFMVQKYNFSLKTTTNLFASSPAPLLLQEKGTGIEVFGLIPRRMRGVPKYFNRMIPPCSAARQFITKLFEM